MELRFPNYKMYFIIIAIIVALDQVTKYLIQANMQMGQSSAICGDLFYLTYIHNYGAAFSLLQNHTGLLIAFPSAVTLVVMVMMAKMRKKAHWTLLLSMALIAGGGVGNLIDRVAYGYVVDFFDFRIWPIFNVADIAVCCGCAFLVIYMLIIEPKIAKKNLENKE